VKIEIVEINKSFIIVVVVDVSSSGDEDVEQSSSNSQQFQKRNLHFQYCSTLLLNNGKPKECHKKYMRSWQSMMSLMI
jgi:hypothetical protein